MNRTRRSLAIIALATLAGGTALLAASHRFGWRWHGPFGEAAFARNLPELAPADSTMVIFADVNALRESPLLDGLQNRMSPPAPDADYAAFMQATGFDYKRDLDRVVFATHQVNGKAEDVAIADGRFDRQKIRSYALTKGKIVREDGAEVYLLPEGTPGTPQAKTVAFAFMSDTRIAISDSGNLDSLLEAPDGSRAAPAPATEELSLDDRISRAGDAPLFMVLRVPDEPPTWAPGGVHSDQLNELARSVRWIDLKITALPDHLHVTLEGECVDQDKAASLEGTLTGLRFLAEAYLGTPSAQTQFKPAYLANTRQLLESAVVAHNARWVSLSVDLNQNLLNTGLQAAPHPALMPK
jgi:hypothetical protein